MRILALALLFLLATYPVSAQTALERFKNICESKASSYVSDICANTGEISRFALNMPRICRGKGWGDQISQALKKCDEGNVYSDIWKFVYNDDRSLEKSIALFIEKGTNEGSVKGSEGLDRFGLFEIFYLACAKNSACHHRLFSIVPQKLQQELARTPLFCDYLDVKISQFASTDDSVLINEDDPTGFGHPTCQKYYCLKKDCTKKGIVSDKKELFILSHTWTDYYQRVYEGNLND